jgi:hypothetical protein
MKSKAARFGGRLVLALFTLAGMVSLGACQRPTSFEGRAQFPGGPQGCYHHCQQAGLEMATFVYVGEYSTACACKLRSVPVAAPVATSGDDEAVVAAAAGVELQRRRIEEQQRQQQQQQQQLQKN